MRTWNGGDGSHDRSAGLDDAEGVEERGHDAEHVHPLFHHHPLAEQRRVVDEQRHRDQLLPDGAAVPGTTVVQDLPGRVGLWHVGVPPSGPMDARSFALGTACQPTSSVRSRKGNRSARRAPASNFIQPDASRLASEVIPVTVWTRFRQMVVETLPLSLGLIVSASRTASRSVASSAISLP